MPNHVTNRWTISGPNETLREVFDLMTVVYEEDARRHVTFRKLCPMPEILRKIDFGQRKIDGEWVKYWIGGRLPGDEEARKLTEEEEAERTATGFDHWYDWACANWGTKWDAFSDEAAEILDVNGKGNLQIKFVFITAWTPPLPIVDALRERFPDIQVNGTWRDEDGPGGRIPKP